MLATKKVLALVVGRGGSKGLPAKNLALCGGRPMVAWSVHAARGSRFVDRVVVSSDSDEILAAADADVRLKRPPHLATDDATMLGVVEHALDAAGDGCSVGVLLQATSPLRLAEDIDGALELMLRTGAPSVVSMTEASKSPYWMYTVDGTGHAKPLFPEEAAATRRQALPTAYALNGAVYAFDVAWFRANRTFMNDETLAYLMPTERSVDVDSAMDLALVDLLFRKREG